MHPIQFGVDYPDVPRNRLTAAFRLVLVIPILVVLGAAGATVFADDGTELACLAAGVLFLPPLLLIVFRQKYPRWWFDFNVAYLRFDARVFAYALLLRDEYPSTDDEQAVHLDMPYPDVAADLNRWLPLVKWFLAIPHYVALFVLGIGAVLATIAAWFAILFTGRHPRGASSTSPSASCAGTTGSPATPSPWSPTRTRRSGWRPDHQPQLAASVRQQA